MRCYFSVNCPAEKVKQTLTEERSSSGPGAPRILNALHKKFSIGFLRNNDTIYIFSLLIFWIEKVQYIFNYFNRF